ncbi:hypothetical protein SAY86_011410 [Trapa natans]|uniref:Uncharacterized protein n=1 Tax=Trapa natans TaxID=22666 RepID=A0AAN7R2S8_TRANT|nr:hypothetical protein SAY86_011410 [Trapa natans]
MKSTSEISGGSNNWLGFSLSPNMKMEAAAAAPSAPISPSPAVPTSYVLSPSFLSPHSGMCSYEGQSLSTDHSSINEGGFQYSVMPIKSDGSLCIMEALSISHPQAPPKLEDFLTIGGTHNAQHQHSYGGDEREAMPLSLDNLYYPQMGDLGGDVGLCLRNWVAVAGGGREDYEQSIDNNNVVSASAVMGCGRGELQQSLSLSMSPGSQSSCVTTAPITQHISAPKEIVAVDTGKKRGLDRGGQKPTVHRKSIDTFGQRTSQYRGVTRNKEIGPPIKFEVAADYGQAFHAEYHNSGSAASDWKMDLYSSHQQNQQGNSGLRSPFAMAVQDVVGMESVNMGHPNDHHEPAGGPHFSNHSSMVTSLASSREGSPERMEPGPGPGFRKPPIGSKFIGHPQEPINSAWIPSAMPVSLPNYPVFTAWGDV